MLFALWLACADEDPTTRDAPPGEDPGSEPSTTTSSSRPSTLTSPTSAPSSWRPDLGGGEVGADVPTTPGAIADLGPLGLVGTAGPGLLWLEGHPRDVVGIGFPGTPDGIRIEGPGVAGLDLRPGDPFTVEVGFRTDVHGRDGALGAGELVGRPGAWAVSVVDGRAVFSVGTGHVVLADPPVSDGRWHALLATRDADGLRLSVDGAWTATAPDPTAGQALAGEPVLRIGAGFLGDVDHVGFEPRATPPWVSDADDVVSTVFQGGVDPVPEGGTYASLRIPAIVQAPDGALLAFAEARVDSACDFGNIDVVTKISTDRGRTWSPLARVIDNGTGKVGNPIPFVDYVRGRVVLLTTSTDGTCEDTGDVRYQVQHSDDDGRTWGPPVDVTASLRDPAWNPGGLVGPSHGIQLRTGPEAGALVAHAQHRRDGDNVRGGHLLVSRDGGETWSIADSETESAPDVEVNEGTLAELSDGRLYVNVRSQVEDVETSRPDGLRGEAFVGTDLQYQAEPPFAPTPAFRGPVVHGTTLRWFGTGRYGDPSRILFSFPGGEYGTNFGQRHDLRLHASLDDAASFAPGVRIYGGKASYSDLVALDEVRLGVLYETALDSEGYNTRIVFRTRVVQQLDDPTLVGFDFEDPQGALALGELVAEGPVAAVPGRHHSTAAQFDGTGRACVSEASLAHAVDLGLNDGLEVEVRFRTTAHGAGGSAEAGTLVAKTAVGTDSAWWLRVEDGRVRFAVGDETGALDIAESEPGVSDGAWHTVRAVRDPAGGRLEVTVDRQAPAEVPLTADGYVANAEDLCVGSFGGPTPSRAFVGEVDAVAVRLVQ